MSISEAWVFGGCVCFGSLTEVNHKLLGLVCVEQQVVLLTPDLVPLSYTANNGRVVRELLQVTKFRVSIEVHCVGGKTERREDRSPAMT